MFLSYALSFLSACIQRPGNKISRCYLTRHRVPIPVL